MSANLIDIKDYEENADFRHGKTNPIQTQLKPKQSQSKPISRKGKTDAKCVFTKDYEKSAAMSYEKTNPKQSQFSDVRRQSKRMPYGQNKSQPSVLGLLFSVFCPLPIDMAMRIYYYGI